MFYSYRNPAINRLQNYERTTTQPATYSGIALKGIYYVLLTLVSAATAFVFGFEFLTTTSSQLLIILLIAAPFIAFIFAMIASFKPLTAPITGSFYALFEGLAVGFISLVIETAYSGVVFAALLSTIGVLLVMLVLYSTGIIRVGNFFKKFMISALIGILFSQLIIFVIGIFNSAIFELFYGNSNLSIGISIVMVIIASLMILFDLQRITEVVNSGLDKRYEWSAAFGLLVTIVWLYLEFLRLFAKIASRRN